jgi:uncharacterized membrane protein YfcA
MDTQNEPVAWATAIRTLVEALIALLVAFNLDINDDQRAALLGVILPVMLVGGLVAAWWARRKVRPVAKLGSDELQRIARGN